MSSVSMAPVMLSRSSTSVMLRTHVDGDTSARLQLGNYTPQLHAPDDCEGDIHAAGDDMSPVPGALHPRPVLSAECLAVGMSLRSVRQNPSGSAAEHGPGESAGRAAARTVSTKRRSGRMLSRPIATLNMLKTSTETWSAPTRFTRPTAQTQIKERVSAVL